VYCLAVWEQYNAQVHTVRIGNFRPAAYAAVGLYRLPNGVVNDVLNPFQTDEGTVGALAGGLKIIGALHDFGA